MTLYDIVKKIEATSGKNDKLAILKENASNDDLREFFYLCLEPTIIFWIKKIPNYTPDSRPLNKTSLMDATYDLVNDVASRNFTGHDAINRVRQLLESLSAEDAELLERIIKKDARCGVSEKTVNKVWKGLCTEKIYMRCASFSEANLNHITYKALCQIKADGLFINTIVRPSRKNVTFLSRNMKPMGFHGYLEPEFLGMDLKEDSVIHGEGLVLTEDRTGYLPRKLGNAIITKAIEGKKGISEEEASRIVMKVWDILPLEAWRSGKCDFPYDLRLRTLEKALQKNNKIKIIATKMVNDLDEAYDFFNLQLSKGREGCILKNLNGIWKDTSSGNKDCVKMKKKDPADLLCTGTYPHKQEYVMRGDEKIDTSNWIGGLVLQSADGIIVVNSGSGLDDELRAKPPEYFINHIWEIEYNEIITSKNKDTMSLFLPIIKERRDDKDEADTYELILERSKANKNKAK